MASDILPYPTGKTLGQVLEELELRIVKLEAQIFKKK